MYCIGLFVIVKDYFLVTTHQLSHILRGQKVPEMNLSGLVEIIKQDKLKLE
jgi:hypothetical protein